MNIQTTLAKCRAELKRQKEVKQYQRSWSEKARLKVAEDMLDRIALKLSDPGKYPFACSISRDLPLVIALLGVAVMED